MIKVGIVGYGNLGKACERAVRARADMETAAIFSRRKIVSEFNTQTADYADLPLYKDKIDIMLLCGGSATDLTKQSNEVIKYFNTADSFDTHAQMNKHFSEMDASAKENNHIALIATGWDPGLFSVMRVLFESILPEGDTYTFWGKGVSQGHSEAVRNIKGVKYAVQYTVPKDDAVDVIKSGGRPVLTTRQKHLRECYVVPEDGADTAFIESAIENMPDYFADYDTLVHFITEADFLLNHRAMPHGGMVLRSGEASGRVCNTEFKIKLESNPDFTAGVLVAYARAAVKMRREGKTGAVTVFDIPVSYLSDKSSEELIGTLL